VRKEDVLFEKVLFGGKPEQKVIDNIRNHIRILYSACELFKDALLKHDKALMLSITDLEREGDIVRREIVSNIYEGAFLPFLRPSICRFVEIVDEAVDSIEDAAIGYGSYNLNLDKPTEEDCLRIADLNIKICEMLSIAFETLFSKEDLREKSLVIRIYEKKVDEIKFEVLGKLRETEINNFWDGKILSDFISSLTRVSDIIEDASDYLYIVNVSLR
jgi:predicted phosphate transport protein (TIGR00153 family)